MIPRLVVSTECPTCAAPLDFGEGSNAVQCRHCRSNLLVTGRKQLLSYFIAPRLDVHRAVAKVMLAHKASGTPCRVVKPQLYFIPYYRLTGHDFRWEKRPKDPKPTVPDPPGAFYNPLETGWGSGGGLATGPSLFQLAGDLLATIFEDTAQEVPLTKGGPPKPALATLSNEKSRGAVLSGLFNEDEEVVFRDRYVERNFVACDLGGIGLYSLGVRPAVLRLELFRREALESKGKIVAVQMNPEAALSHGLKAEGSDGLVYREVIGRVLSLVYFPLWAVEVKREGKALLTLVDAISEGILKLDAAPSVYEVLDRTQAADPSIVGFRPLSCPNCGWDLPVRPEDVIFFCRSCEKAWQIMGRHLYEVSYQIAAAPTSARVGPSRRLPFWVLETAIEKGRPFRFFVPAFRFRRLKFLAELAKEISRKQPDCPVSQDPMPDLHGCYYDQEDAAMLARFTYAGMTSGRLESSFKDGQLPMKSAALIWFPFKIRGNSLLDPFTGRALPRGLLL